VIKAKNNAQKSRSEPLYVEGFFIL
jgi:hypothetical protein